MENLSLDAQSSFLPVCQLIGRTKRRKFISSLSDKEIARYFKTDRDSDQLHEFLASDKKSRRTYIADNSLPVLYDDISDVLDNSGKSEGQKPNS